MGPRRTHHKADERSISTVEYAVLFVLIVVGLVGAWKALNNRMNQHMESTANRLDSVLSTPVPPVSPMAIDAAAAKPAEKSDAKVP